jgi:formate hydrogenlyase transcriptional activator
MNRPAPRVTQATMSQLTSHEWPGNVRELQNAIERAVILAQGNFLQFDWLQVANTSPAVPAAPADTPSVLTSAELKRRERENLTVALAQTGGKVFGPTGAAALLGMNPRQLSRASRPWVWNATNRPESWHSENSRLALAIQDRSILWPIFTLEA